MEIRDLGSEHQQLFFKCLEDWSDEMAESGDRKEAWYSKMSRSGLRVKLAHNESGVPVGMIQYAPIEHSPAEGTGLHFVHCVWVHGYKEGCGDFQGQGIGSALLKAAEDDARAAGSGGMVAWGLSIPVWMRASWFKKHGYVKADKDGVSLLVWKRFSEDAKPPRWIKQRRTPGRTAGKVTVTSFNSGWCPAQNIVYERAKRVSSVFGDKVRFEHVDTSDRERLLEWGISDALFIDGKQVRTGPPPSFDKIKKLVERRVRKLR